MKYLLILALLAYTVTYTNAQRWTDIKESNIIQKGKKDIVPANFRLMQVDDNLTREILWQAPNASSILPKNSTVSISIPLRKGKTALFKISEYDIKEPALAKMFPNIKSFIGVHESDPLITLRADYTVHGLRAVIDNHGVKTFIDHYQRNDKLHKIIYLKDEFVSDKSFTCNAFKAEGIIVKQDKMSVTGNCVFKQYQMTISATSGYTGFHGATSAAQANLVMSAIETSINRINGVYEREVAARFILVGNTNLLWFYNYNSDPFGGNAANPANASVAMLNINKTETDNAIGLANYDIGHVYSLGDGGIAQTPAICLSGKARGATGRDNPVGDPFDVDYVAHEMGHQFGGNHVQNNACNRNDATAVEPGSGSSIMGYAGICAPNVDTKSHDNFHSTSLAEMKSWIDGQSCHTVIPWANNAPVVNTVMNKTLPISTPFVLTGVAVDQDNDPMLYTWDQTDNEIAIMPPMSNNINGPAFRARPVSDNPSRYFPQLEDLAAGNPTPWEVLTSVFRTMDFTFTARDSQVGVGGCTSETDVTLTFTNTAGPFLATAPNGGEQYLQNETISINWTVANTDVAPVSCANVDILLSIDGGLTYPTVLVSNTLNDGMQDITLPMINTATARIMVICSDNYFFDISDGNFTISDGTGPTCATAFATDLPITISESGTPTITSNLSIRDKGLISDINIVDLKGNHTYLSDLDFVLSNIQGTEITIVDFPCNNNSNFDFSLDDNAANPYPCPVNDGMTYQPFNALSGFNGSFHGQWTLTVSDGANIDGGALTDWGIEYCALEFCDLTVNKEIYGGLGSISEAIDCAVSGDTIWLENTIIGQNIDFGNNSLIINKDITIVGDVMTVLSSTNSSFTISVSSGNNVSLIGVTVANSNSVAISNDGNLVLQDMNIMTNGSSDEIQNGASGTVSVKGICNIQQ